MSAETFAHDTFLSHGAKGKAAVRPLADAGLENAHCNLADLEP